MAYTTICNVRNKGITPEIATDEQITSMITIWESAIDKYCNRWFEPRSLTFKIDGSGIRTLFLPIPIITLTSLKINDSTTALDEDLYIVYNSAIPYIRDDRQVPKIVLKQTIFCKGLQNQELSGTFGYVESDGSTPDLIVSAATSLVVEKILNPEVMSQDFESSIEDEGIEYIGSKGQLQEETTEDHSWRYGSTTAGKRAASLSGISMSQEVIDILNMYKNKKLINVVFNTDMTPALGDQYTYVT